MGRSCFCSERGVPSLKETALLNPGFDLVEVLAIVADQSRKVMLVMRAQQEEDLVVVPSRVVRRC